MKSIILCEGTTDLTLIQYFMEVVHGWKYIPRKNEKNEKYDDKINDIKTAGKQIIKWFHKDDNLMAIFSVDGVSKIINEFGRQIEFNSIQGVKLFDKIVLISDNDEAATINSFVSKINNVFKKYDGNAMSLCNDEWKSYSYKNTIGKYENIDVLLLIIPFSEKGAMETFLLDTIGDKSSTDKKVIEQCNKFIDNIDTDMKYLQKRREVTKAKFNTYFVIRTPAEAFGTRRDILQNIKWEEYELIRKSFKKLGMLS